MKALALCALVACATPAWKVVGASATGALVACDYAQTLRASDLGKWDAPPHVGSDGHQYVTEESNPLLGRKPGLALLTVATALSLLFDAFGATRWSPDVLSAASFVVIGGSETYVVAHNYPVGGACGL